MLFVTNIHLDILKKIHKCQSLIPEFAEVAKTFYVMPVIRDSRYIGQDVLKYQNSCTNHKHIHNVILAYRMEMVHKWNLDKRTPVWHNRGIPDWVKLEGDKYEIISDDSKSISV